MFSKSSIVAFFTAGLAAVANAQVHAIGTIPNGNPIGHPGLAEQVTLNQPFSITWQRTSPGQTVTLWLCIGQSTNCVLQDSPIAVAAPNNGAFVWTPTLAQFPNLIPTTGSGYGIQLVDDSDGRIFQYSTQFGITFVDAPATITLSSVSNAPIPTPVPEPEPVPETPTVVTTHAPFPTSWWAPTGTGAAPTTIIQPTGPVGVPTGLYTQTTAVSTPTPPALPTGAAGKVSAGMGAVAAVVLAAFAL